MVEIIEIDKYGRIVLPRNFRKKVGYPSKVMVIGRGDYIIIKPLRRKKLTEFFDTIGVDIAPDAFSDYNKLKQVLLGESK
ncbi:MAG: AbrB/MazE/SpoVT family DNA-binding domain-containing protein [Euryarchaeota archaeon]|nr:AbrB/MazE/SpoVT family DNA-binding domain-containing protein [Euryarchaeota archaeon]